MTRSFWVSVLLSSAAFAAPAFAQDDNPAMPNSAFSRPAPRGAQCGGGDPVYVIVGCTAVIQSNAGAAVKGDAYNNRGIAYLQRGQPDRAAADFEQAVALNPKNPNAWINRANTYQAQGKFDLALKDYEQALQLRGNDSTAHAGRADTYLRMGQPERAIPDYDEAIKSNAKNLGALVNRGEANRVMRRYDRAAADFTQAIALNGKYAAAYDGRAAVYADQGNYDRAIADYNQAAALEQGQHAVGGLSTLGQARADRLGVETGLLGAGVVEAQLLQGAAVTTAGAVAGHQAEARFPLLTEPLQAELDHCGLALLTGIGVA